MYKHIIFVAIIAAMAFSACGKRQSKQPASPNANQTPVVHTTYTEPMQEKQGKSIYDYSYTGIDGKTVQLAQYNGKKLLIVNTASECGYTGQYEQLEQVYRKYSPKLVIIGFPTNDFGGQEPGSNEEIEKFCKKNFDVTFPMSQKITVVGKEMHPLYKWLTNKELNGKLDSEIKWNFQKYLIDENGNLISVYYSKIKPDATEVISEIEK